MENKKIQEDKTQLKIAALENGTVIDHIPPEKLFKIVALLEVDQLKTSVMIGNGLKSKKMGEKGILKIADIFFEEDEINRISLVAPLVKLNIIHNYRVVEKKLLNLPDQLIGLAKCTNPKCVTNNESMETRFLIIDKENVTLQCFYCEIRISKEFIVIDQSYIRHFC